MNLIVIIESVTSILQLLVAAYTLRLNRLFGMGRVGWSLFCAFSLLALLHLTQAATGFNSVVASSGAVAGAIYFLISLLLFTGMIHLETALQKRALQEREESWRRAELELEVKKKTGYLMRAIEGLDSEMAERKRMEAKAACLDLIRPRLFDCFSEMIANIPAHSILRVLAEESYMLSVDLADQRALSSTDVGSILIFSQFVGAGGKCPHRFMVTAQLPRTHVAFYRKTIARLIDAGDLPSYSSREFEKIFGNPAEQTKAGQTLLPSIYDRVPQFQMPGLAHC